MDAREPQVRRVAALAGGAVAEQARAVADERDAHLRVAGRGDGGREPGPVGAVDRAARGVHDVGVGQLGAQGLHRRRHDEAHLVPGNRGSTWVANA